MGRLDGKVAIVTGAGQGLGAATARLFADEGAAVAVVDWNKEKAASIAEEILGTGGRALAVPCDVRERAQVDAAIAATVAAFGTVDILVQYAQIIVIEVPFEELTEQQLVDSWRSGCLGSMFFMQGCLPYMKKRGGRIVNAASGAALTMAPGFAAYASAKQAIRSMTRVASKEWGKYGITVNAICPVSMTAALAGWRDNFPDQFKQMANATPLRYVAEPVEIARHVLSIITDMTYCTGMTFMLDGGTSGGI